MRVVQDVQGWGAGLTLEGTLVIAERPFPGVPARQLLQEDRQRRPWTPRPSSGAGARPASWASRSCCGPRSLSLGF